MKEPGGQWVQRYITENMEDENVTKEEKARIIFEEVDRESAISTYLEDDVMRGIIAGLTRIEKGEADE